MLRRLLIYFLAVALISTGGWIPRAAAAEGDETGPTEPEQQTWRTFLLELEVDPDTGAWSALQADQSLDDETLMYLADRPARAAAIRRERAQRMQPWFLGGVAAVGVAAQLASGADEDMRIWAYLAGTAVGGGLAIFGWFRNRHYGTEQNRAITYREAATAVEYYNDKLRYQFND